MNEAKRLSSRLGEVLLDGKWVANTNYREQLEGLDWRTATELPPSGNSIALLAQHIHYYVAGVKQVFEGGPLQIRDQYSFDFPAIASQTQWNDFLERFWQDSRTLIEHVAALADERLEAPFVEEKYGDYRRNINGMIEHCYYHLGQIVLLKKQFREQ
jgi:hypothetical protein